MPGTWYLKLVPFPSLAFVPGKGQGSLADRDRPPPQPPSLSSLGVSRGPGAIQGIGVAHLTNT